MSQQQPVRTPPRRDLAARHPAPPPPPQQVETASPPGPEGTPATFAQLLRQYQAPSQGDESEEQEGRSTDRAPPSFAGDTADRIDAVWPRFGPAGRFELLLPGGGTVAIEHARIEGGFLLTLHTLQASLAKQLRAQAPAMANRLSQSRRQRIEIQVP